MTDETMPIEGAEDAERPVRAGRPAGSRLQPPRQSREAEPRDDPRAQAPAGERLQRTRRRTDDRFYIDMRREPPQGMSWEWKRESCVNQPDPAHISNLQENHWIPVSQTQRPGKPVKMDGMVLMQRPQYLTDEARREDYQIAVDQVRGVSDKLTATPAGTLTRDHPSARANTRINRSFEALPVLPE